MFAIIGGIKYNEGMGLKICSLFSGSTGNCTYVCGGNTELIIDAGVPLAKTEKALRVLGADCNRISVLVTHRHSDHIAGLASLAQKYPAVTVYAHERTAADISKAGTPQERIVPFAGDDFYVGDVTVSPLRLSHDVFCVGFALSCGGKKITYLTDTGFLPETALAAAQDSDLVMIESNHSPELLYANKNYPFPLKQRILGMKGHLSNEDCAAAVVRLARGGVRHFILAHLSKENNYPELAYSVCEKALMAAGLSGVGLEVACADRLTGLTEIV